MATMIEAQGHTVDEAIQIALNQLGLGRDKVEIEVIHHPRRGFLGIGARRAKVRATVRDSVMSDGEEFDMSGGMSLDDKPRRRRRRGGRNRGQGDERPEGQAETSSGRGQGREGGGSRREGGDRRQDDRQNGRQGERQGERQGGGRQEGEQARAREGEEGGRSREGGRGRGGRGGRGRGGRGGQGGQAEGGDRGQRPRDNSAEGSAQRQPERDDRGGGQRGRQGDRDRSRDLAAPDRSAGESEFVAPAPPVAASIPPRPERPEPEPIVEDEGPLLDAETLEAVRIRGDELIRDMLARMGFVAEVTSAIDEENSEVVVSVRSESEGLLIGRRGQTLDSIEHILNRMVLRGESYVEGRIQLDIGDYRRRRREALEELAARLRERAVTGGRSVQVSPMSPRDRRFFAEVLAADPAVEVRTLGAGFYRRVIVAPAGMGAAALAEAEEAPAMDDDGGEPAGAEA